MEKEKEKWNSKIGFILSAAGSAIGLGNLWKFPYIAGQNGGGTFILIYAALMVLIGIPLLVNDFVVGRFSGNSNVLRSFDLNGKPTIFSKFTYIYPLAVLMIMSFYFVIFGWTIYYLYEAIIGNIHFTPDLTNDYYVNFLNSFIASPYKLLIATAVGILASAAINLMGIVKGIERVSLFMLPLLFVILVALAIRSVTLDGSSKGLAFYFSFDFKYITFRAIGLILGQVLFSLSLGASTMIVYASYLKKDANLVSAATATTIMGFLVAAFAGLIVFPSTFALGYDVTAGKGLAFVTFPAILAKLPFGQFFAILFFILLGLAAITSAISFTETITGVFMDKLKLSRKQTVIFLAVLTFIISIPSALSLNIWQNVKIFSFGIFDITDYISSVILLPLGGLLSCLFTGYFLKEKAKSEFTNEFSINKVMVNTWYFAIKYILPFVIILILIFGFFA